MNRVSPIITRRDAIMGGAGLATFATKIIHAKGQTKEAKPGLTAGATLRVASCQFPVSENVTANSKYIQQFIQKAVETGAHLLHTSESALSGWAGMPSFKGHDWDHIRHETKILRETAKRANIYLVLGSAHFLDKDTLPTNCLYVIDPTGAIIDRYDKSFITDYEMDHYSPGDRLVTCDVRGVRLGLAICNDLYWPQFYIALREKGVTVMLHSFNDGRGPQPIDGVDDIVNHVAVARCVDNRMSAVCNNSSIRHFWPSFVAHPNGSIPKRLPRNERGMLIYDFPDPTTALLKHRPVRKRDDEVMHSGAINNHPRRMDWLSDA